MEAPAQTLAVFFNGNNLKCAIIFAHKVKSNTSFGTVKGLLFFECTHNINKTLCFYKIKKTKMMRFLPSRLEQERFTKMNQNSANTCLTDMINISIESFKLLLNEINQIENKNSFIIIIIREDALLSKGTSNEKMASQDRHLHLCDTDTENTSLLVNISNISLLFPPDTFMVITFAGALLQALAFCVRLNAEIFSCVDGTRCCCCCRTLNTVEPLLTVAIARFVLFPPARQFFFHH